MAMAKALRDMGITFAGGDGRFEVFERGRSLGVVIKDWTGRWYHAPVVVKFGPGDRLGSIQVVHRGYSSTRKEAVLMLLDAWKEARRRAVDHVRKGGAVK